MSTKKSFPLDSIFIWNILMLGATLFLFIAPISATNYSKKQQLNWIPFIWAGDSISEKHIEKAFIYIPIQLENSLYQYTMQFDLGTPKSVFYERPIQFLKQTNSSFIQKWNPKSFSFQHLNMRMGNVTFSNTEIFYMKDMGDFINENDYLQYCYNKLSEISGVLFIHGHSLNETDQHIFDAINKNLKIKKIYISVHKDTETLDDKKKLAKKRLKMFYNLQRLRYYDADSANIW